MLLTPLALSFAASLVAAEPPPAAPALATKEGRARLVLLDLQANGVDADSVKTITDVIGTAFAGYKKQLDVVSAADLRAMMNVEAARQTATCGAGDSCMAEVAAALGADLLVHGSVGKLGQLTIVNLSLFDASKSSSVGREKVQSSDPGELSTLLEGAVQRLAANVGATASAPPASPAPASSGGPNGAFLISGIGVGVVGLAALGVGGFVAASNFGTLEDPLSSRADKDSATGLYPAMLATAVVGGVAVAAGAGLAVAAFVVGGD